MKDIIVLFGAATFFLFLAICLELNDIKRILKNKLK
jgi:hypothetical protein